MEQGNSGVGAWNHRVQLAQFGFAVEGAEQVHVERSSANSEIDQFGENPRSQIQNIKTSRLGRSFRGAAGA